MACATLRCRFARCFCHLYYMEAWCLLPGYSAQSAPAAQVTLTRDLGCVQITGSRKRASDDATRAVRSGNFETANPKGEGNIESQKSKNLRDWV